MEEIPLFLPKTASALGLGIPGFSDLTPVPSRVSNQWARHNRAAVSCRSHCQRKLWALRSLIHLFFLLEEKAPFSRSLKITTDEIAIPPTVLMTRKTQWLVQLLRGCWMRAVLGDELPYHQALELPECFWNSQDHRHLPFPSLAASPGTASKDNDNMQKLP